MPATRCGHFHLKGESVKLALIALTLGSLPLVAQQAPAGFTVRSVTDSGQLRMNALADKVFHFFTPTGEREWCEGWDPEFLSPADGSTQKGMVFRTSYGLTMAGE